MAWKHTYKQRLISGTTLIMSRDNIISVISSGSRIQGEGGGGGGGGGRALSSL